MNLEQNNKMLESRKTPKNHELSKSFIQLSNNLRHLQWRDAGTDLKPTSLTSSSI